MLKSRQIKFVVGAEEIEYIAAHESTIAALSKILEANFANTVENSSIYWEDVEPDTFANLMEYAYWKDHNVPPVSQMPKKSSTAAGINGKARELQ